ncbi:MAG TPA: hypothetical protein VEV62_14705 [Parafilimonas sp.]|jgi:hypothetical protein|nr:hypothetical protein [Parafilimonas sp.]
MNTNTDISGQLKNFIDKTDGLTAKNILEMLEVKETSLWFRNELTGDENDEIDSLANEEKQLSFEQVKQMYPEWFNE